VDIEMVMVLGMCCDMNQKVMNQVYKD